MAPLDPKACISAELFYIVIALCTGLLNLAEQHLFTTAVPQNGAQCPAKNPPSSHGPVSWSLHSEAALHDCDRVLTGRLHGGSLQADQRWARGSALPEARHRACPWMRQGNAVPSLQEVSKLAFCTTHTFCCGLRKSLLKILPALSSCLHGMADALTI